jgi:aminodeoxychorismate synthase component I
MFVDTLAAYDHINGKLWLIANPGAADRKLGYVLPEPEEWADAYDHAVGRLDAMSKEIFEETNSSENVIKPVRGIKAEPLIPKEAYERMVVRAKDYIAAGDIFQANLSQRLSADVSGIEPWDIYAMLREVNPSPFASFMEFPDIKIASSSPERLVRVLDGVVDTRPIAGTRPRGKDSPGDDAMRSELLLNEKERAEHIMLIDLERNDLGRVCDYGSVRVDELMVTEDYSHVIHIVSNVTGTLAKGKDAFDVIRATFPGGTITGVPKVRCMQIIDELEPVARGPYTGSIGYISYTGDMDLNIIIRTFVIKDNRAYVQVGAGIVADSDPEREYYETLHKAEALIKTLEKL